MSLRFQLDGRDVDVPDGEGSLLDALREDLGVRSVKDGCSPQGQCGCCTVLVDGAPRVACVTPVSRVAGRSVTTVDGLPDAAAWAEAFTATGASQCGFCTPGIIVRLAAAKPGAVDDALLAHLCRCTGWQTIREAAALVGSGSAASCPRRDLAAAAARATIEGGVPQAVGPAVALGGGGFADDTAPPGALVGLLGADGAWVVGETLAEARAAAGRVPGRRGTIDAAPPIELPPGDWVRTLRTSWVEPGYLEPDAAWCAPGGEPVSPLANGGAFGGKVASIAPAVARRLADEHGRPVRVLLSREDVVRLGPKRPPIAAGIAADGRGIVRVARTPGIADAIAAIAPSLEVEEVDIVGPPTSAALRAAGWAEAAVLLAGWRADRRVTVTSPVGATAWAEVSGEGAIAVGVDCGAPLDPVTLRSYCIGAAHMGLSWVTAEAIAVDADGRPLDLTIRSFGVVRAKDTPPISVEIADRDRRPVNGSDAVFAAVAGAVWVSLGCPPEWPTNRRRSA
ncbi:MAG: putative oxidoreductase [Acidimicrobiales bacterium]|nr:putative oxidoreductase [Acidimicrobiales bacterium]